MRNRKAQSILEYVIVLTVIIAAIVGVANSALKGKVQKTIENSGTMIEKASEKLPLVSSATE